MSAIQPVVLSGWGVSLQPLSLAHVDGLVEATADGDIWRLNVTSAPAPDAASVTAYIEHALQGQSQGTMLPFVVVTDAQRIVGTTRFYDIDTDVPNLAIGYTWYAASVQRTHVNTACKRLLLGHAFDTLNCAAVYFHTSHLNLASRAAIARLGAKMDGVIRHHKRHKDGSLRDTWSYSIVSDEWPEIKADLEKKLAR